MPRVRIRVPLVLEGAPDVVFSHMAELMKLLKERNVNVVLADICIEEETDSELQALLDQPIETLGFSERPFNCLKRAQIHTLGELLLKSADDLLAIANFGQKCIDEVIAKLTELGLTLR